MKKVTHFHIFKITMRFEKKWIRLELLCCKHCDFCYLLDHQFSREEYTLGLIIQLV